MELLRKHMDSKGKQAKLKSPAELQVRSLLLALAQTRKSAQQSSCCERPCSKHCLGHPGSTLFSVISSDMVSKPAWLLGFLYARVHM